jgi:NAD(P)-dependent dehydrogenase (short-subunit alcohol dehydrogenase family)
LFGNISDRQFTRQKKFIQGGFFMPDLNGQVAVITGASSGIGAALALEASRAGAKVVLAARRSGRLQRILEQCAGECLAVPADLTSAADRQSLVECTLDRFGRIDILFNNAGLGAYGDFLETGEIDWRRLFEINLFAPVLLTQLVVPHMIARGSGRVVNVASIGGLVAHSDRVCAYVASKHAMVGFSRGLAKDLAVHGLRVIVVCPHLTDTQFFAVSPGARQMAPVVEKYRSHMDSPAEVARGILAQLDSECLVVFPTDKPARAYAAQRDL